jgi:pimeloyl-ACP methyl ester carboxylesterase
LEQGTGPPVVLVHGLGLDADVWQAHLAALVDAGYRAVAPDLPGFGETPGPVLGRSIADTSAWLDEACAAIDVGRAAWVGHSLGAQHVLHLAAEAPERVAAAVLAAPIGRAGRHSLRQIAGLMATAPRERPSVVAGVVRRYVTASLTTLTTWLRSQPHDSALDAAVVTAPTLLVHGEEDAVVSARFVRRLETLMRDARATTLAGSAHAVALDPVEPFLEVLLRFLGQRYDSPSRIDRWNSSGMLSKSQGSPGE